MAPTKQAPVQVACLDLAALVGFFRSVALAVETQANTKLEWKNYDESTVLNIAYAMMPWKAKPGMAEVSQNWNTIREGADTKAAHFFNTFLEKLSSGGPAAAGTYAEQMQRLKQDALQGVQMVFNDARQINAEVAGQAGQAARNLATIQFTCTILLAATGCYVALGGAVPAVMMGNMSALQMGAGVGAVNLGYNITGAFVKDAFSWKTAQAVAIEVGKDQAQKHGTAYLERKQGEAAAKLAEQGNLLQSARARVEQLNQKLAGKLGDARRARYTRGVATQTGIAQGAQQKMAKAGLQQGAAKVVAKGIPIVYLAMDIWNASSDLQDVYAQTR